MSNLKRKFVLVFVSFALAFVALHPIINFHFYRIFDAELAKIDNNFIKKEESYLQIAVFKIDTKSNINLDFSGILPQPVLNPSAKHTNYLIKNFFHNNNSFQKYKITSCPNRGSPTYL